MTEGTDHAETLHKLWCDWVVKFGLAVKRFLAEVVDKLLQTLKLARGAQHIHGSFFVNTTVLDHAFTSARVQK